MIARQKALEVLLKIKQEKTYSSVAIDEALSASEVSQKDKNLITEIVYGTLTNENLLEFWVEPFYQGRVKAWVRMLLLMTVYQMKFLDKIPDYAAIDDAVNIAKLRGGEFNANVVNVILRKLSKLKSNRALEEISDVIKRQEVEFTHQAWMIRLWNAQFGEKASLKMLKSNNMRPPLTLRTNVTLTTTDELMCKLAEDNVIVSRSNLLPDALVVNSGNIFASQAFVDGLFYVQDVASQIPAIALAPTENSVVLDVCAAPGGKTFQLASMVGALGKVYAHDLYAHKIERLNENKTRLQITNVEASVRDALKLDEIYEEETFDYILVDAPCSGLGILRRHPEAKLTKTPEELDSILYIQKNILESAAPLLKSGGRLVYSTCSVNLKENHKQVELFLKNHDDFEIDLEFKERMDEKLAGNFKSGMLQLLPQDFDTDGFFVAALIKK